MSAVMMIALLKEPAGIDEADSSFRRALQFTAAARTK